MSAIAADARNAALVEGLAAAVPLRIWELEGLDAVARNRRIAWWAREAAGQVAHRGDVPMYGGAKSGQAAAVFNHLARGLAAGAFAPGGVTFAGRHWCARECPCPAGIQRDVIDPPPLSRSAPRGRVIETVELPEPDEEGRS